MKKKISRSISFLSKDQRERVIKDIIYHFSSELDLEIGMIAAEDMLDFFLEEVGENIYSKAIEDSRVVLRQGFEGLEIDVGALSSK